MLFYLDNTIGEKLKELENGKPGCLGKYDFFFEMLGYSAIRGNCYLCGERKTMKFLANNKPFERFYKVINRKNYETDAVLKEIPEFFVLTFLDSKSFTPAINLRPTLYKKKYQVIPVDECINQGWRLDIECILLSENLRDCSFYTLIGKRYLLKKSIKGICLRFLNDHGGGGDTGRFFRERVKNDHIPTLCITDSDWKYGPSKGINPEYGGTASNVRKAYAELGETDLLPLYDAFTLEVHEAENLIPLQVLNEMLFPGNQDMSKGVKVLNRLAKLQENPSPLLFYDFKAGISLETGKETKKNSKACVLYWSGILKKLGEKKEDFFVPVKLINLLEKAVDHISDNQSGKYLQDITIDSHLQVFWEAIGKKLLTWGCAFQPVRA